MTIWDTVPGHADVVAQLQAAAVRPVHAYMLVGPPGAGARAAATAFAASLVCANGGCGTCRDCTLVLQGEHPDVETIEPDKTRVSVDLARELAQRSSLAPSEGGRRVMVLTDFHRVHEAGPALLKTIEEPPATTFFIVLADQVHDDLVTIASRCVRVDVPRLTPEAIAEVLVAQGVESDRAMAVARGSLGDLDRARVLLADPQLEARRGTWWNAPDRLDGTGAAVAAVASEIRERIDLAAGPLREVHAAELAELEAWVAEHGERGSGRAKLVSRQNAEARRHRADELRFGLATLAARYREALADGTGANARLVIDAVGAIDAAGEALTRNPNETLLLQSLLLKLPAV